MAFVPLSIAVIGAGGIGSAFAYRLATMGHDVTVVARPGSARLQQLESCGAIVLASGESAKVRVCAELDARIPYDLALVTTLAHQVDAFLPALTQSSAKSIQFMFNCVEPERLRSAAGPERSSFGMPFIRATIGKNGRLDWGLNPGQKTLHGDPRWSALFDACGIPSAYEPEMARWVRCHAPVCIALESVAVAAKVRGAGASWREATIAARGMLAAFAVTKSLGGALYPAAKVTMARSPAFLLAAVMWCLSRISSFRELLATGASECRALVDTMVEAGASADPALPDALVAIRAMKPPLPR